jgi:hypothetical protein
MGNYGERGEGRNREEIVFTYKVKIMQFVVVAVRNPKQ